MGSIANQSYFWPVIFASIGGGIVVVGLVLELLAEKKWFKTLRSMRFWNSAKTWGEWFVIVGICIEIADAGWTAYEISNVNANSWQNKPIYAFSARATVIVRPFEPVENLENLPRNLPTWLLDAGLRLPKNGNGQRIDLTIGDAKQLADESWAGHAAQVFSDNVSESLVTNLNSNAEALRFDIFFDEHSDNFFIGNFKPNEISGIELLLPLRCEVLAGKIEMVIDGGLTNRNFDIPQQKSLVHEISSFETNGHFAPLNFSPKAMADAAKEGAFSKVETNVDFLNPPK